MRHSENTVGPSDCFGVVTSSKIKKNPEISCSGKNTKTGGGRLQMSAGVLRRFLGLKITAFRHSSAEENTRARADTDPRLDLQGA